VDNTRARKDGFTKIFINLARYRS